MPKRMLIDALHPEEMRVVIADNTTIHEFDFVSASKKQVKGNIYLAKITRVEPSLQAAFVEYGGGKQGFLPFAEIHPDYYQIPVSDRKRLMEEVEREIEEAIAEEEAELGIATPGGAEDVLAQVPMDAVEFEIPAQIPETFQVPESHYTAEEQAANAEPLPSVSEPEQASTELAAVDAEADTQAPIAEAEAAVEGAEAAPAEATEVETIMNEEDEASSKRKKRVPFFKRYRIQEVIKRGQVVLVQVIKDERGNKGVSLTTYLSLAGRYSVLMPNSPRDGGVSRKISDLSTRRRLKELMEELKLAKGMSVIIRTAGVDRTMPEIRRDFDYLVKLWNHIRDNTLSSTAPALIYEESNLIKRSIRDQYTSDIDEVIVQGEQGFEEAKEFMALLLPSHTPRVKLYNENMPLFYSYGIEDQLLSMYDPVVKLKSGGYIVINPTEALISIDVNSGRSTSERNVEETAIKTNTEAAYEIARQLRLRDLAGLIVIDFIDMMEARNRRVVERSIKDALRSDRAKIQLGRISPFGLLEMSRQRMRPSISEASTVPCSHCGGRGVIRSNESLALHVLRTLEKDAGSGQWVELKINVPQGLALYLLNHKRHMLTDIQNRYGVALTVSIDMSLAGFDFTVDKIRKAGARAERDAAPREPREPREHRERNRSRRPERDAAPEAVSEEGEQPSSNDNISQVEDAPREGGRRSRGGRRRGGRNRDRGEKREFNDQVETQEGAVPQDVAEGSEAPVPMEGAAEGERRPRGRGGRGGRRRWKEDGASATAEAPVEQAQTMQPHTEQPAAPKADVYELPSFTRSPVRDATPAAPIPDAKPVIIESSARPEGAPPRKGWWQKMIELE